ncbi:head-to-tail adaptor [Rhodobacter phage RcMenchie]|nr:head-to-tail adaptor [Rhodobacter phage RcMenchie]
MIEFCTISDVKVRVNGTDAFVEDDEWIAACIRDASSLVSVYTRSEWKAQDYTKFVYARDVSRDFCLKGYSHIALKTPVIAGSISIKSPVNGDFDNGDDFTAYIFNEANGTVLLQVNPFLDLRITYMAGYPLSDDPDTPNLVVAPSNIRQATIVQAAFGYMREKNRTVGTSAKTDKAGSATYKTGPSGLCAEALALLRTSGRGPMVGRM